MDPGEDIIGAGEADDEYDWDKQEDYTACSFENCNYCGQCSY